MAHLAGADEELFQRRTLPARIAALLPFGLWHWPWRRGSAARGAGARGAGVRGAGVRARVPTPLAVSSLPSATAAVDSAAPVTSMGGAAIAAAVIALAGAGGAVVGGLSGHGVSRPVGAVPPARATTPGGGSGTAAHRVTPRARVVPSALPSDPPPHSPGPARLCVVYRGGHQR